MPKSIRFRKERPHNAFTMRRRVRLAAALTLALMLAPGLTGKARAADINTPVVSKGYVATDASEICTFWEGLGVETPFVLTDDYGRPVSWKNWIDAVNVETYNRFFNGPNGFRFLVSKAGQAWIPSPTGQAWAHSPTGREWINGFARSAPADRSDGPVDYVRICDIYGAGFYYIPGTETCLNLGRYARPQVRYENFESLQSGLQSATSSGFSPEELQDMARAFSAVLDSPSSTPQPQGQIRMQRGFGGPNDAGSTAQTTQQNGGASAGDGTTTPSNATSQAGQQDTNQPGSILSGKIQIPRGSGDMTQLPPQPGAFTANGTTSPGATTQAGTPSDGMITFRIFVKGHVSEGNPPGPPVPGQFVRLVGGNVEPDLPISGTTRTADQENTGSDKGAPQGISDANGIAKFKVEFGDLGSVMRYSFLRDDLKLDANYTLNGTREVQKHGGFVAPAPDNTPAPNFSRGSLDGVMYRWNEFSIGTQTFWEGGYSVDYNVNVTPDQVKEDIIATLRKELGPGITVTFDGNVCRIELPARVTGPYTPAPQSLAGGIPEATITLGMAPRRDGGAP